MMELGMSVIPTLQQGCIGIIHYVYIVRFVLAMGKHIDLETIGMIEHMAG